jgi:hypothetical protein
MLRDISDYSSGAGEERLRKAGLWDSVKKSDLWERRPEYLALAHSCWSRIDGYDLDGKIGRLIAELNLKTMGLTNEKNQSQETST